MNFEEKLEKQFTGFSLVTKRHTDNLEHLYADYLELLCILSSEDIITPQIYLNRFKKEETKVTEVELEEEVEEIGSKNSEKDDAEFDWASNIFSICEFRNTVFLNDYPFQVSSNSIQLKEGLSIHNKIYLSLLLASNLNYFSDLESYLTTDFETISYQALSGYFDSQRFTFKQFGKNSDYEGTAQGKIRALGTDLFVEVNEDEVNQIQGNQERGLDLACWNLFQDKIPNYLSVFVQCACGKDWFKKQSETRRFQNAYFRFYRLNPINSMFVPYSLQKSESNYYQSDEIDEVLFFERKRIIETLKSGDFFEQLDSLKIVDACIEYEEDLV